MAAAWFTVIVWFGALVWSANGMYEDQAGKFDWKHSYVGRIDFMHWDQSPASSGKKILVATEKNILASIHAHNGSLAWRKVFEENERGRIDSLLHQGSGLFSIMAGGWFVRSWYPGSGNMAWEVILPAHSSVKASATLIGENKAEKVVVATGHGLFGLHASDGKKQWELDLPNSDTVSHWHLNNRGQDLLLVGISPQSKVTVAIVSHDGALKHHRSVPAAWITVETSCQIVGENHFLCYSASFSLHLLSLSEGKAFVSTPLKELNLEGTQSSKLYPVTLRPNAEEPQFEALFRVSKNHMCILRVSDAGITVYMDLPKVSAAQITHHRDKNILLTLGSTISESMAVTGYDLSTGKELAELSQKISFAHSHGYPTQINSLLFLRKKDGRMSSKILIISEDYCVHYRSGKVSWRREEALAYILTVEMVDLPVSENQAKFEDEFGSREDDIVAMFVKRLLAQLSQLQNFVENMIQKLQGHRHHHSQMLEEEDVEGEGEGDEGEDIEDELTRDEFNLHKIIVAVTSAGKIFGIRSHTGRIVWQQYLPELSPFTKFGMETMVLLVQRTTAHFPHLPQCLAIGKSKKTGNGLLYAFNPIAGVPVDAIPSGGLDLGFIIKQVMFLPKIDEHFLRGVMMISHDLKIHLYPKTMKPVVEKDLSSLFFHLTDIDAGTLKGYRVVGRNEDIAVDQVWNVDLQRKQQVITNVVSKRVNEHVHSQGRVLGDRSVLYKYLNPNLVVVTTEGEEPGSSSSHKGPSNFFNIYLIDGVTGHIVFHVNHKRAKGPVSVVHSENWVVYSFFSEKQRRPEIAVLEMFEGKEQSNSTAFSSFNPPPTPLVLRQSYIFPLPLSTMAATVTEKGITSKNLIIALKFGGLLSLPKALLDPRRPVIPTQETMEEGTIPYIPEIPIQTEAIINYNQSVFRIMGIHTAPAGLESTCLILAYGVDLYHTRVTPSKMFDVLKEDFDYFFIGTVLLIMIAVSFISQKLAARKALNRAWK